MKRRDFLKMFVIGALSPALPAASWAKKAKKPNVLFIAIDDLRPMLGCYGDQTAVTPNINRLAKQGMVFDHAYCQQAVCNPSRASLITGLRPDTIRVWDLKAHFRDTLPDVVTLPQYFKENGYHCRSIGKILHGNGPPAKDPPSWSEESLHDTTREASGRYALPKNLAGEGLKRDSNESADVPDSYYIDGIVCRDALKALRTLKGGRQPFFLAVGFRKPHLPFCAPKKYWDYYKRDKIPLPVSDEHPKGAPELAVRSWKELEGYRDIPEEGLLSKEKVAELRHGYYACVSYMDALTGRLLDELERLELREETIVLLWGDHGFHLGEQGLWAKANNYEFSTRAPLILSVPGQANVGAKCDALVEFVDVYPTLVEACKLRLPDGLEGLSMMPLIENPARPWKRAVFSQYPRDKTKNRHNGRGDIMGNTLRTGHYRYVEWRDLEKGNIVARELYDHNLDPGEMKNLAASPEYQGVIEKLSGMLDAGWQAVLPLKRSK